MDLQQIDILDPKALEAPLSGVEDRRAGEAVVVDIVAVHIVRRVAALCDVFRVDEAVYFCSDYYVVAGDGVL